VRRHAVAIGIGHVEAPQIDERNILRASLQAMRQAVEALVPQPEALLVDAVTIPGVRRPQLPIVHGDALPLERRRLLKVSVDKEDRRSRRLALAPAGRALLTRAYPIWKDTHGQIERLIGSAGDLRGALRALS
jgi:hypothetical protein